MATATKTRAKRRSKVDRHAELVQAAERRAKVVAFVNAAGKGVRQSQISEHFGWDAKTTHNTMRSLRDTKEVEMSGGGGRGNPVTYFKRGGIEPVEVIHQPAAGQLVPVATRVPRKYTKQQANGHSVEEMGIELVIGGVTAVMGRNPVTGRPRVTFEFK